MADVKKIIKQMREQPNNVRYADAIKVCTELFGKPRTVGGSHSVFKTPWQGDPRINLQRSGDKAKQYQVKQVLQAIDRLESLKEI